MKNQLKMQREKTCLTQRQIAEKVGITERSYQRYENGERTPSAPTANSIARALGTTSEKLFGFKEILTKFCEV